MKKSCILLFIMSILSLLIATDNAMSIIHIQNFQESHPIEDNSFAGVLANVAIGVSLYFSRVLFIAAIILGIAGLLSSLLKGRLSIVCIILDSLPLAYMFYALIQEYMDRGLLFQEYAAAFAFSALYMTGAIIAFKGRKNTQK